MRTAICRASLLASGILIHALTGAAAMAQQTPPIPPAGQVQLPRREQVEQPAPQPEAPASSTVRVEDRGAIENPPCALENSPLRLTLSSIRFVNPQGEAIAPRLQALLGDLNKVPEGQQPISVVCRIRDRANDLLSNAGYVALAQIPAQEIKTGELKIEIVAARIVEVRIVGDLGAFGRAIRSRIDALRELDPLNRRDAERILLRAGDIPGVDVRLALSAAGTRPGEVIGSLSVETRRAQLLVNTQNFGSRQLGPSVISLRGEYYGLTGLADRTFLAYSNSAQFDEIKVAQFGHDFALNGSGLRAMLRGSLSFSQPSIPDLDLRSRSEIFGVELSQELIRGVGGRLGVTAGAEALNQRTRIYQGDNKIPFTRDKLRVVFGRVDGDATLLASPDMANIRVSGYGEVRKGVDLLGASKKGPGSGGFSPSRFDGNPQAVVVRGEVVTELRPHRLFAVTGQAFGQWANDPLLNLEEFSLGNFTYGRGYDPGSNGGDRVYAFRVEPRITLPLGLPVDLELTGFYDYVRLYNLDPGSQEDNRLLRSVGGGVRVFSSGLFVLDAFYAKPLDRALSTDNAKPRGRFLLSITTQLYPWGVR